MTLEDNLKQALIPEPPIKQGRLLTARGGNVGERVWVQVEGSPISQQFTCATAVNSENVTVIGDRVFCATSPRTSLSRTLDYSRYRPLGQPVTTGLIKYVYNVGLNIYVGGWKENTSDLLIKTLPSTNRALTASIDNLGDDDWVVSLIYSDQDNAATDRQITFETIYSSGISKVITLRSFNPGYFNQSNFLPVSLGFGPPTQSILAYPFSKGFGFYYAGMSTPQTGAFSGNTYNYAASLQFVWQDASQSGSNTYLSTISGNAANNTQTVNSSSMVPILPGVIGTASNTYTSVTVNFVQVSAGGGISGVFTAKVNQDGSKAIGLQVAGVDGSDFLTWFSPTPQVSANRASQPPFSDAFNKYVYDVRDDGFSRLPTTSVTATGFRLGDTLFAASTMSVQTFDTGFNLIDTIDTPVLAAQNSAISSVRPLGVSYHP